MLIILLTFILLLGCAWLLQTPLQPITLRPHKASLALKLIESSMIAIPFLLILLLTQRLLLATLLTLTLLIIPIIVNHAKYRALREPLVFSDFYLYIQVFTHPRLFLPFLNIPITVTAIMGGIGALTLILIFDQPRSLEPFSTITLLAILIIFLWRSVNHIPLKHIADEDIRANGFYNSLLISSLQAINPRRKAAMHQRLLEASPFKDLTKPLTQTDILVVQSESFCDIRSISSSIKRQVLQHYDKICSEALASGSLSVPAWGANTLRPEFAFLSGVDNTLLKHYRYNPYQFLQNSQIPTLASYLKQKGYYTICLHPNHAEFFKRDRIFPQLGFDEFIDIRHFQHAEKDGPYISDAAVVKKTIDLLKQRRTEQPLFIFVITMENHGPLHLETVDSQLLKDLYQNTPPEQHHDLSVYLKHLKNADNMLKELTDYLRGYQNEVSLCWYGDHVPSMPDVYQELTVNSLDSCYLVWNNQRQAEVAKQSLAIENLALKLLES